MEAEEPFHVGQLPASAVAAAQYRPEANAAFQQPGRPRRRLLKLSGLASLAEAVWMALAAARWMAAVLRSGLERPPRGWTPGACVATRKRSIRRSEADGMLHHAG